MIITKTARRETKLVVFVDFLVVIVIVITIITVAIRINNLAIGDQENKEGGQGGTGGEVGEAGEGVEEVGGGEGEVDGSVSCQPPGRAAQLGGSFGTAGGTSFQDPDDGGVDKHWGKIYIYDDDNDFAQKDYIFETFETFSLLHNCDQQYETYAESYQLSVLPQFEDRVNALEKELDRLHEARDESSGLVTVLGIPLSLWSNLCPWSR